MRVGKVLVVLSLCGAISLGGCVATTSPQRVASLAEPDTAPRHRTVTRTEYTGEYALYSVSPHDRRRTLLRSLRLGRNEPIGFRVAGGRVSAIAGSTELPLGPGQYLWELKADPGQPDWRHTTVVVLLVVVVVILCVVTGVALYAAATLH